MASKSSTTPPFKGIRSFESNFRFEIDGSKLRDLQFEECISSPKLTGECILSPTFNAGGYDWVLAYYPQGFFILETQSHASLILRLQSDADNITAEYSLKLLSETGNVVTICQDAVYTFSGYDVEWGDEGWGVEKIISRGKIEDLYCEKDFVIISCDIRVLSEPKVVKNYPGGLFEHIEKLWEKGEGFDVTFEVEGERISAHRFMLMARSPVFKAKLCGPMAEAKMESIKIDEMKAEVFKALLHFVYTDQLAIDESSDDETCSVELLHGLFVAADRYALEKLTLLCEEELVKNLSVDTVVTTLVLADRHSCARLKRKCLEFASDPENFSLVALTEGYLHIMPRSPSLFAELSDKVRSPRRFAKKLRTG